MATRKNPFEELERLFERMGRQLESLDDTWTIPSRGMGPFGDMETGTMPLDVEDVDGEIVVTADMPGFDKDEISVNIDGDMLTISAEHETESETTEGEFLHQERLHRSVKRSITLPTAVESEAASARYKNGVLTVTLTKSETPKGKHIEIE
ncbi:Hsp20/alpha crystallin family protein [Haloarchaeobius sp. DFWS5]|uniref:Hsp20/alpha crystallin family protein n=1 Tax=Haloarchaeobius sp. DFWS5 TaxID=3446114 RepID=UPI003EBE90A9